MRDMDGIAPMSASGSGGPSPDPKLSSAPGPPSRSALARSRERAASILPSSVPAIRYAGLIAPGPSELAAPLTAASVFRVPAGDAGRVCRPSSGPKAAQPLPVPPLPLPPLSSFVDVVEEVVDVLVDVVLVVVVGLLVVVVGVV